MSHTVAVAVGSVSGTVAVAIAAVMLSVRRFHSVECRLEMIAFDLKTFFRGFADHDKRLSRLEEN
jgi:hypothetical protein